MLRRIFILFVLLGLSFVIYKYVNPQGADSLIEKAKTTWNGIFSSESTSETIVSTGADLLFTGDALSGDLGTGDMIDSLFGETTQEITSGDLEETDDWLKDLEQEIKTMIDEDVPTKETSACAQEGQITQRLGDAPIYCCGGLSGFMRPNMPAGVGVELLCYAPNKGTPTCKYNTTPQEGWYYTNGNLLFSENCDATVTTTPSTTTIPAKPVTTSPNTDYQDTKNIFDIFFNN